MINKKRRTAKEKKKVKQNGIKIEESGRVKAKSRVRWLVSSQSLAVWHAVILAVTGMYCTCPHNSQGNAVCKHIMAVMHSIGKAWTFVSEKIRITMPDCCHNCRSTRIVKNGRRRCKKKKKVQRYMCRDRNRTFSGVLGFKFRHYDRIVMTSALLHSDAATAKNLKQAFKVNVHPSTIQRWVPGLFHAD